MRIDLHENEPASKKRPSCICKEYQLNIVLRRSCLWWHISAAIYEIAIVIILENFHENSKFPGNFHLDSKRFSKKYITIKFVI